MKTYRATKAHTVKVYSGLAEVNPGELVRFAYDPGEGWEEVTHGSDTRATRRTVGSKRSRNGDDKGGV
jgi:hypothetical protein